MNETKQIMTHLADYLTSNEYESLYSGDQGKNYDELNKAINDNWSVHIGEAIKNDFKQMFANNTFDVEQTDSIFRIKDPSELGDTTWKSFVRLTNEKEQMNIEISFSVIAEEAIIHLGTNYFNSKIYTGENEIFRWLFTQLYSTRELYSFFKQTSFF
jgi:hypothetical protein